jgi:hypothetical protein
MDLLRHRFAWLVRFTLHRAVFAQTGRIASAGFLTLGAAWIVTTGLALRFILQRDLANQRRLMIRSFALTAAITLRLYLPLVFVFHWPFSIAHPAIAGLCWVPNAIAAGAYLRFAPSAYEISLPATLVGTSREVPSQRATSHSVRRCLHRIFFQKLDSRLAVNTSFRAFQRKKCAVRVCAVCASRVAHTS